jgi:hypothetical protein
MILPMHDDKMKAASLAPPALRAVEVPLMQRRERRRRHQRILLP